MWKLLWGLEGTFHFLLDKASFWGLHVHFWTQIHIFVELVFEHLCVLFKFPLFLRIPEKETG